MSYTTLKRWLGTPSFQQAFRTARRQLVEAAVCRVQQMAVTSSLTLYDLLKSGKEAVRLKAASAILSFALKGVEIDDILSRLEALEELVKRRSASTSGSNGYAGRVFDG